MKIIKKAVWSLIKEEETKEFSNFKLETSRNGGDYGFWTVKSFFSNSVTQQVASVERKFTTSSFKYTHDGNFSDDSLDYIANDTNERFFFQETGNQWDRYRTVSLEQFPTFKIENLQ